MKISTVKKIDYWLGIPICFLLTAADFLARITSVGKQRTAQPRKILFIKPSEIGAIILSYPLMKRMKERYPHAELYFLTFQNNSGIFDVWNIIDRDKLMMLRDGSLAVFFVDLFKVLITIRRQRFDIVFDLEFFSRFTAIVTYLSGAPQRVGFYANNHEGLYRGELLTHKISYNPRQHISKTYLSMDQGLGRDRKAEPYYENGKDIANTVLPIFMPDAAQKTHMQKKLAARGIAPDKRLFLINLGEGRIPLREWPVENFAALAKLLLQDQQNILALVGLDADNGKVRSLFRRMVGQDRLINLIGQTTTEELLILFTLSAGLIANDCGMAHLASLTRVKQYILFGPESPVVFAPLSENLTVFYSKYFCSPCLSAFNHRTSRCTNNQCLKVISPQDIFTAIAGSLSVTRVREYQN